MKLFEKSWILRIDPKDPNAWAGMPMEKWVSQKFLKDAWVTEGIPLRSFGYDVGMNVRVRVKWVSTVVRIFIKRNKDFIQ